MTVLYFQTQPKEAQCKEVLEGPSYISEHVELLQKLIFNRQKKPKKYHFKYWQEKRQQELKGIDAVFLK